MRLQEIEAAPQAGQHAERQHIDLEQAERFQIVLVPFDDGALLHRRILDRHDLVEPRAGDDEAADMLREVARKIDQLLRQLHHLFQARVGRIEPGAARFLARDTPLLDQPQSVPASARDRILRQAEHLAHFADGAAAAIADHGRGQAGALAAVFLVDVLDDLLAPLMLEIDVDVGRLAPLRGDEALEQKIDALGDRPR